MTSDDEKYGQATMPFYLRIAMALREQILDGTYPKGSHLPTEAELATTFHTSRKTVRTGIDVLCREGLLERRRGFPARVRPARPVDEVPVVAGETVTARMPTREERAQNGIPEGVPMLIVGERIFRADRYRLAISLSPRPGHHDTSLEQLE